MKELEEPYKDPLYNIHDERVELPKAFNIICCPNCDTEIPAADLNIGEKIGKCGSCQAIFSIEKEIQNLRSTTEKIKQEILRPEGIELFHFRDELEITFEQSMGLLEWILFIFVLIFGMAGVGASVESSTIIPFILLTVFPMLISIVYYFRRKAKHRIILSIDDSYLNIIWRPRKFHIDQNHYIKDIKQLYVKHRSDLGTWQLKMIIDEGNGQKHVKLASVNSASKAKYLEQEIESHLDIQDVVVPEES